MAPESRRDVVHRNRRGRDTGRGVRSRDAADLAHPVPRSRGCGAIAHELQHAIEATEAAEVIEKGDLAGLFRRIGYVSAMSDRVMTYETEAARRLGDDVLEELQRSPRMTDSRQTQ